MKYYHTGNYCVWWASVKRKIGRFVYSKIYGFNMEGPERWIGGTMLPATGPGKFVSVYVKGKLTQIVNEETGEQIILIPVQYNHGVMVEYWKDGKMYGRSHIDFEMFKKIHLGGQEIDDVRKLK
jgi:hypothetical protein